jgi:hypothetical protein
VWDGEKIVVDASLENLEGLRTFFKDIGGYVEHSQLSNDEHTADGWALNIYVLTIIRIYEFEYPRIHILSSTHENWHPRISINSHY